MACLLLPAHVLLTENEMCVQSDCPNLNVLCPVQLEEGYKNAMEVIAADNINITEMAARLQEQQETIQVHSSTEARLQVGR